MMMLLTMMMMMMVMMMVVAEDDDDGALNPMPCSVAVGVASELRMRAVWSHIFRPGLEMGVSENRGR